MDKIIIVALLFLLMMCLFIIYAMVKKNNKNTEASMQNRWEEGNNNDNISEKKQISQKENRIEEDLNKSGVFQSNETEIFEEAEGSDQPNLNLDVCTSENETQLFDFEPVDKDLMPKKAFSKVSAPKVSIPDDAVTDIFEDPVFDRKMSYKQVESNDTEIMPDDEIFEKREKKSEDLSLSDRVQSGTHYIRMIHLGKNKVLIEKSFDKSLLLGRSEYADICFKDEKSVSSEHCRIMVNNGIFYCVDLNSLNGTYVNGSRLKPGVEKEIYSGMLLMIGQVRTRVDFI